MGEGHVGRACHRQHAMQREASPWSEQRKADETHLIRMHGNVREVDVRLGERTGPGRSSQVPLLPVARREFAEAIHVLQLRET